MQKPTIVISGRNGQLGQELHDASAQFPQFDFISFDRQQLDISNRAAVETVFRKYRPDYFINTAAYTAVDKAESDREYAYLINAESVGFIAKMCKEYATRLIHISTDYVFDGKGSVPYREDDPASPVNYYGFTKWQGEQLALANNRDSIILRTSWVYSFYGYNFVKTMLRLMREKGDINVVDDQIGSPTYARDIAAAILTIIGKVNGKNDFRKGIYHFANDGIISWYDFAVAIKEMKGLTCNVHPISTSEYPTPAKRPGYSVMNKEKIQETFGIQLINWKQSLQECLDRL